MELLKRYKRDTGRTEKGFKFVLGKDAYIRIARMHDSNPQFKAATDALVRQRQHELDNLKGRSKNEAYADIAEAAFGQVCITEIVGVTLGDDVITADAIGIARIKTEVPELWQELMTAAIDASNYIGEFDEENSLKN